MASKVQMGSAQMRKGKAADGEGYVPLCRGLSYIILFFSVPIPSAASPISDAQLLQFWENFSCYPSRCCTQRRLVQTRGPAHRAFRVWGGDLGSHWLGLPALLLQVFVAQEVVPAS